MPDATSTERAGGEPRDRTDRPDPPAPAGLKASVVVLNYNGVRYLDTCIEALLAQELDAGFEIIVVDNQSSDGSVAHLRERWPQVRVVVAGSNLGFAGGNNLGMREAGGEHVVLLNNDTRVRPGWLGALVGAIESDPEVGAVASKLIFMDRPGVIQNAGCVVMTDGSGGDRGTGEEDRGQYELREEVFGACAGAAIYSRRMLDDVGMLDDTFFLYYEDTDLSWRMRLRGWRILYEPAAVVEHVHAGTSGEWSPFFIFHVDRNRLFMLIKNAPAGFLLRAVSRFGLLSAGYAGKALLRRLAGGAGGGAAAPGLSRARIQARVLFSLLRHLPEMVAKRRVIRGRRKVHDADITRWFFPRKLWDKNLGR